MIEQNFNAETFWKIMQRYNTARRMFYPYQFDAHVLAYLNDLIDCTEAESVAHVFGTYY